MEAVSCGLHPNSTPGSQEFIVSRYFMCSQSEISEVLNIYIYIYLIKEKKYAMLFFLSFSFYFFKPDGEAAGYG